MTANWISPVPQEARAYQGEHAGPVTRFLACAIDAVVVVVVAFAAYVGVAGVRYLLHPRHFSLPTPSGAVRSTFVLALLICYLALGWATSGRTYGGHVMGLRVVNSRGRRLNPLRGTGPRGVLRVLPDRPVLVRGQPQSGARCRTWSCAPPWSTTGTRARPGGELDRVGPGRRDVGAALGREPAAAAEQLRGR